MIRFACATCGSSLRAPPTMAGKRGRCARCGKANLVPVVLNVDVRRTTAAPAEPSPFRSTADLAARANVEGAMELASARFHSTPIARESLPAPAADFFDQVASRINGAAGPVDLNQDRRPPRQPPPEPDYDEDDDVFAGRGRGYLPRVERRILPPPPPDMRSPDLTRVVVAALIVGAIGGFCVGLIASNWIM